MKVIVLKPMMTSDDAQQLKGQFVDKFDTVVDYDADVYYEENNQQHLLFRFRKHVITDDMLDIALKVFKKTASKRTSSRGKATGIVRGKDKVNSVIAGYFDKPTLAQKRNVLKDGLVPCRTTAFTTKNAETWQHVLPLMQLCDKYYSDLEPERHRSQHALAQLTPEYQIDDTAFSTITVNYNWRTACHADSGDYCNGFTVIVVAEEGQYTGGYLGYPRFGVCVDVRRGDLLLKDPHQIHCNTPIVGISAEYTRLSMIMYYREKMQQCVNKSVISSDDIIHLKLPKKNLDLHICIRPGTTDEKVVDEVLKCNVYEKQKIGFHVKQGESWLDLGGNIGTFALLALSHGASVVTCEPEKDNLDLLTRNLEANFPNGQWKILPVAVTTGNSNTVDLYLCKGNYNKYRHTIYPIRGRQAVSVTQKNINELLREYKFDGIKIDIEGAEIDILEQLEADDFKVAGITKMVYEYSFDIDPSIPRFLKIIEKLRGYFTIVSYTKVNEDQLEYKFFPAAVLVYCMI